METEDRIMGKQDARLIIFDMDGVILDSEPLHENARQMMFKKYGIIPDEKMPEAVGKSSSGFWRKVIEIYHIEGEPYALEKEQYHLVAKQIEENNVKPSEGLEELIMSAKAKGMGIALASSSTRILVDDSLRLLGIAEQFDVTVSGDEIPKKKPAPDVYLKVLELTGVQAEDAVAVEDSRAGIEAARAAGIFCYGYDNPTSGMQDISKADQQIKSIRDIKV